MKKTILLLFLIGFIAFSDDWAEISKNINFGKGKYCESIAQAFYYENHLEVNFYGYEQVDFTYLFLKKMDNVLETENESKHYKGFKSLDEDPYFSVTVGTPSVTYYENYCRLFSENEVYQIDTEYSSEFLSSLMESIKKGAF